MTNRPKCLTNSTTPLYILAGGYIIILVDRIYAFDIKAKKFSDIIWDSAFSINLNVQHSYWGCAYSKNKLILFGAKIQNDTQSYIEEICDITLSKVERN